MLSKIGTYKQRAYSLLGVALFILLACFSYLYFIRVEISEIREDILHNEIIITSVLETNSELLKAENAERGFNLTGDSLFLDNFSESITQFGKHLQRLDSLTYTQEQQRKIFREIDSIGIARIQQLNDQIQTQEEHSGQIAKRDFQNVYDQKSEELADLTKKEISKQKYNLSQLYYNDLEITLTVGIIAILLVISLFIYFFRSQRKISEYNEQLQERNQDLQQFSYIASHDLKEPLRMVKNFLGLIEKKYKGRLDEKADTYIYYAVDGAERMQQLIDDLLKYSRIGRSGSEKEKVDFGTILKDVQKNLSALIAQTEAVIHIENNLPEISVFKHEITRVFQNLISNAIKFRKRDEAPEIHISCTAQKSRWLFEIRDNGIGIPEEKLKEVFEVFSRLHSSEDYDGTGIGLAISKKIIERHGGKIWVESQPNHGSTFYFTLKGED